MNCAPALRRSLQRLRGLPGNHWNRSRHSESRRRHPAAFNRAFSHDRHRSEEFIAGRVCGNSAASRPAGHRLHCRRPIQTRSAHHLSASGRISDRCSGPDSLSSAAVVRPAESWNSSRERRDQTTFQIHHRHGRSCRSRQERAGQSSDRNRSRSFAGGKEATDHHRSWFRRIKSRPVRTATKFTLGIVDVPGHEDFVRNMIAGVGSIDLALLVVAADDGWMPQTEEHLQILTYLGVQRAWLL